MPLKQSQETPKASNRKERHERGCPGKPDLMAPVVKRRVRRLEADGVIAGYRAVIDTEKLGRRLEVTATVEVRSTDTQTIAEFERAIVAFDEVVEARKVFGNPDYFLRILVSGIEEYEHFQMQSSQHSPRCFVSTRTRR